MDGTAGVNGQTAEPADGQTGGRRPGPVTIHDVAREAGVSTSTVSRALDPRLPSQSRTALRVREVAARLGYSPDPAASSLRRGGTSTVGVLVPRLTDTVMAMFYEEVAAACAQRGHLALVATTHDEPASAAAAADSLTRRRVDGLIMTTARDDDDLPARLRQRGLPHVLALRTDGRSPSVVGDDELGGYLATRHLLDLGHTRIGLVAGPAYASSAAGRRRGYLRALAEAGLDPDPRLVRESSFSMEAGEEAGRALLDPPHRCTAIFAVNDNTAIGVLAVAHQLGLRVPEDLSVVGYNDIPIASRLPIPLTTLRVPFRAIATAAVDMLLAPAAEPPACQVFAPTLIPRASTARVR